MYKSFITAETLWLSGQIIDTLYKLIVLNLWKTNQIF